MKDDETSLSEEARAEQAQRNSRLKDIERQAFDVMRSAPDAQSRYEGYRQALKTSDQRGATLRPEVLPYVMENTERGIEPLSFEAFQAWEVDMARREAEGRQYFAELQATEQRTQEAARQQLRDMQSEASRAPGPKDARILDARDMPQSLRRPALPKKSSGIGGLLKRLFGGK